MTRVNIPDFLDIPKLYSPFNRARFTLASIRPEWTSGSLKVREKEIALLVAAGYDNQDIARQLSISINTVRNHLSSIFDKLGIFSRCDLAGLTI